MTLLFGSVGCDQVSKQAALRWLSDAPGTSYLGDTFRLTFAENRGAFLGLGAEWPEALRWVAFTLTSGLLVLGAFWFAARGIREARSVRHWGPVWGPLLVVAGGVGNLLDRILRDGSVIDFMNLGVGPLRTGVFNVADVYIMAGIALWTLAQKRNTPVTASRA